MIPAILRGPGSFGLFSSSREGRKRRITKTHSAKIKRINRYEVEIEFGTNLHPLDLLVAIFNITVSAKRHSWLASLAAQSVLGKILISTYFCYLDPNRRALSSRKETALLC